MGLSASECVHAAHCCMCQLTDGALAMAPSACELPTATPWAVRIVSAVAHARARVIAPPRSAQAADCILEARLVGARAHARIAAGRAAGACACASCHWAVLAVLALSAGPYRPEVAGTHGARRLVLHADVPAMWRAPIAPTARAGLCELDPGSVACPWLSVMARAARGACAFACCFERRQLVTVASAAPPLHTPPKTVAKVRERRRGWL